MIGRSLRVLVVSSTLLVASHASAEPELVVDAHAWRVLKRDSGPVNYYTLMTEDGATFIHAKYEPPWDTTVLAYSVPEADRRRARKVRWTWRAITLPAGGDECVSARADSAAVVYVTWKRMLRYYALKFVWSAVGTKGKVCDTRRSPFVAQDTIIVETGGPLGVWRTVEIDLADEYRRHFEGGDPSASVPDFVGLGLMTDGDQTKSVSAADYGRFVIAR